MKYKVVTHSGKFHADDVFAVAVISLMDALESIDRTRDESMVERADLRIDIGHRNDPKTGDFDHHQSGGAGARANGVKYASFGLIWRHFGDQLVSSPEAHKRVDQHLVQTVDALDNGQDLFTPAVEESFPYSIDRFIAVQNPLYYENPTLADYDDQFHKALDMAKQILKREIELAESQVRAAEEVRQILVEQAKAPILVLDHYVPWREVVVEEAGWVQFVIFPGFENDDWALQAVPKKLGEFGSRRDLPADWAGLAGEDLEQETGVKGAAFCHKNLFFAVGRSQAAALALAKLALK